MTPMQISGLAGQWVAAIACILGIVVVLHGVGIEMKYKADRGFKWVTVGALLIAISSFIFAMATKFLGF